MATHPPACAQNCPLESGTGNYLLPVVTQVGWWHPAPLPSNGTAIPVANFETATSAASWHPGGENSFLKENITACYTKTDPQPRQCCWLVAQNRWLQGPVAVGGGASARSCTMRSNQLADQPQFLWPLHQEVGQAEQAAHRAASQLTCTPGLHHLRNVWSLQPVQQSNIYKCKRMKELNPPIKSK